jgi:hypothetical protein
MVATVLHADHVNLVARFAVDTIVVVRLIDRDGHPVMRSGLTRVAEQDLIVVVEKVALVVEDILRD